MTACSATISVTNSGPKFTWDTATWSDIQTLCKARASGTITST
jgi:hypothetical protein